MKKNLISVLLTICMLVCMMPVVHVLAAEDVVLDKYMLRTVISDRHIFSDVTILKVLTEVPTKVDAGPFDLNADGSAKGYVATEKNESGADVKTFYIAPSEPGNTVCLPKDLSGLFANAYFIEEVDLIGIQISEIENMSSMFKNCYNLKRVVFPSDFDINSVKNTDSMFYCCGELTSVEPSILLQLPQIKTIASSNMFFNCVKLNLVTNESGKEDKTISPPTESGETERKNLGSDDSFVSEESKKDPSSIQPTSEVVKRDSGDGNPAVSTRSRALFSSMQSDEAMKKDSKLSDSAVPKGTEASSFTTKSDTAVRNPDLSTAMTALILRSAVSSIVAIQERLLLSIMIADRMAGMPKYTLDKSMFRHEFMHSNMMCNGRINEIVVLAQPIHNIVGVPAKYTFNINSDGSVVGWLQGPTDNLGHFRFFILPGDQEHEIYLPKNSDSLFENLTNVERIYFDGANFEKMLTANRLCDGCINLRGISGFEKLALWMTRHAGNRNDIGDPNSNRILHSARDAVSKMDKK